MSHHIQFLTLATALCCWGMFLPCIHSTTVSQASQQTSVCRVQLDSHQEAAEASPNMVCGDHQQRRVRPATEAVQHVADAVMHLAGPDSPTHFQLCLQKCAHFCRASAGRSVDASHGCSDLAALAVSGEAMHMRSAGALQHLARTHVIGSIASTKVIVMVLLQAAASVRQYVS